MQPGPHLPEIAQKFAAALHPSAPPTTAPSSLAAPDRGAIGADLRVRPLFPDQLAKLTTAGGQLLFPPPVFRGRVGRGFDRETLVELDASTPQTDSDSFVIRISNFEFHSSFEFRHSSFPTPSLSPPPPLSPSTFP
jgi:hypothetical protein